MTRVLVFFPHNLFPPRSGAHHRCLQVTTGLRELGAEVVLASSSHTSETKWVAISEQEQRAAGISRLEVHKSNPWDARYIRWSNKLDQWRRRSTSLALVNYAPPGLRRWFEQLAKSVGADVVLINYAFWGGLVTPTLHQESISVMDTLDLVSLYRPRFMVMEKFLVEPPFSPARADPTFLAENFFDAYEFAVAPEEYQIYDRFKYTIAITRADADLIRQNTQSTRVVVIPMTQPICALDNAYDGDALYTPGRNPFNVQGYLYFAARVLPRVLERSPKFGMTVTGALCEDVLAVPGIELRGFVPDLRAYYQHAPFTICPILGKTGQQIKIVEAMAHGVPVIATRAAAEGSPIRHEENGLIAGDAAEFAEHVIRLWRDRALCKTMGDAARETIEQEFSQARLLKGLSEILGSRQAP